MMVHILVALMFAHMSGYEVAQAFQYPMYRRMHIVRATVFAALAVWIGVNF